MSCYQPLSATAEVKDGATGFLLIVKVNAYVGDFVPTDPKLVEIPLENATDPLTLFLEGAIKGGNVKEVEFTKNLKTNDEVKFVTIICQGEAIEVKYTGH